MERLEEERSLPGASYAMPQEIMGWDGLGKPGSRLWLERALAGSSAACGPCTEDPPTAHLKGKAARSCTVQYAC